MYLVGEKREHNINNKVNYKLNKRELFAGRSETMHGNKLFVQLHEPEKVNFGNRKHKSELDGLRLTI